MGHASRRRRLTPDAFRRDMAAWPGAPDAPGRLPLHNDDPDRALRSLPLRLAITAVAMLALAVLAFWPQYLSKFRAADAYTHLHAVLGLAWLLLLVAQPLLFQARRLSLHCTVGRYACALGAAFVLSGVLVAHRSVNRMTPDVFEREGHFVYLPLVMAALFAAALALGVAWRTAPAVHARFMACTALPLLDPLLARILFFHFPPLPAEFLYQTPAFLIVGGTLALLLKSLPRRSAGRSAFGVFSLATTSALLLFFLTPYSAGWLAFARWFRSMPMT